MEVKHTAHVAMVPSPGLTHLLPLTELAKRLVHHHISVTLLISAAAGASLTAGKSILKSLPTTITTIFLPPVDFDDLPDSTVTRMVLTVVRSLPALRDSLSRLIPTTRFVALVVDPFSTPAFEVAKEFGISPYIFFPSTAMGLALAFHLPTLDETYSCEYRDLPERVKLPGCVLVHGSDLPMPLQDRKGMASKMLLENFKIHSLASGILVNSFKELEDGAFTALMEADSDKPAVYPVGPLIKMGSSDAVDDEVECLKWLDQQPSGSVLFVSFGSHGILSNEQLTELAYGLEVSGERFLWVVRSPGDQKAADAAYLGHQSFNGSLGFLPNGFDSLGFLPTGFLDRTKGLGLVVPNWAPQFQILSHGSTGGFSTHCGWNSTLESIACGVPLIAWPLFAEQKMNAVLLSEDLKVALRVKPDENGLIGRDQIAKYVKSLVKSEEGEAIKERMRGFKDAAAKAVREDGSSCKSLATVANIWKKQASN